MSELISNLNTIESCKLDIKSAIEAKGVDMTSASLPDYAAAIGSIPTSQFVTTTLSVSQNGTYTPGQGVDGYSEVVVSVPQSWTGYTMQQAAEKGYFSSVINDNNISYVTVGAFCGMKVFGVSPAIDSNKITPQLLSVTLNNCSILYEYAFTGNAALEYVSLPNCTKINGYTFYNCYNISQLYLPNLISCINGYNFYYCSNLSYIELPQCVSLGDSDFAFCTVLNYISLPVCKSLTGNYIFQYCGSLYSINLPECIYIEQQTFHNCTNLETITFGASQVCQVNGTRYKPFAGTKISSTTGSIYVPSSLVAAYKSTTYWTYYSNIIFPIPE